MTMFTTAAGPTVGKHPPIQGSYDSGSIAASDSVDIPLNASGRTIREIKVLSAGNVSVQLVGGGTAVLTGLSAGQSVLISATRVMATGTTVTAGNIVGKY